MNRVGWPSGLTPVDHRSARACSSPAMAGSAGAVTPVTMPGRRWAPWRSVPIWATAPAAQMASRRDIPKQSKAPLVASASSCGSVRDTRRARSSGSA